MARRCRWRARTNSNSGSPMLLLRHRGATVAVARRRATTSVARRCCPGTGECRTAREFRGPATRPPAIDRDLVRCGDPSPAWLGQHIHQGHSRKHEQGFAARISGCQDQRLPVRGEGQRGRRGRPRDGRADGHADGRRIEPRLFAKRDRTVIVGERGVLSSFQCLFTVIRGLPRLLSTFLLWGIRARGGSCPRLRRILCLVNWRCQSPGSPLPLPLPLPRAPAPPAPRPLRPAPAQPPSHWR